MADLERRWTEMESKIAETSVTATAALRAEAKEDVKNVGEAVADLKTTNPENWWERHERTMERTAGDIEADVRRFAKGQAPSAAAREPKPQRTPSRSNHDETDSSPDCEPEWTSWRNS